MFIIVYENFVTIPFHIWRNSFACYVLFSFIIWLDIYCYIHELYIVSIFLSLRDTWKEHFFPRNLIGLSAEPFLLYPTHYTGEPYYISDTEDSVIIDKGQVQNKIDEMNLSGDAKMAKPEADGKKINDASVLEAGKDELWLKYGYECIL